MIQNQGRIERSEDAAFIGMPDARRKASFIRPTGKPSRDEILVRLTRYVPGLRLVADPESSDLRAIGRAPKQHDTAYVPLFRHFWHSAV